MLLKGGSSGAKIYLDYKSKIGEYGLEYWNHALNNLYWVLSFAVGIPILSSISKPSDDIGQVLIRVLVPLVFLTPLIFTIIVRQQCLPEVWRRVEKDGCKENIELFQSQLLWPLDKNWISKLGIVIAFILLSYLVGVSLNDLL